MKNLTHALPTLFYQSWKVFAYVPCEMERHDLPHGAYSEAEHPGGALLDFQEELTERTLSVSVHN